MAEEKNFFQNGEFISKEEFIKNIKVKSILTLPNNFSERGGKPEVLKNAFMHPVLYIANFIYDELVKLKDTNGVYYDDKLNDISLNAVQNKVVKAYVDLLKKELTERIDGIDAGQNLADIVKNKEKLFNLNTSNLKYGDKVQVLKDESKDNASTVYQFHSPGVFLYIGPYGISSQYTNLIDRHNTLITTWEDILNRLCSDKTLTLGEYDGKIVLRSNGSGTWSSSIQSSVIDGVDDEYIVFANSNSQIGWIFACEDKWGYPLKPASANYDWHYLHPTLQMKGRYVAVNKLIPNGVIPAYEFDVNGKLNANEIYEKEKKLSEIYIQQSNALTETEVSNMLTKVFG